MQIEALPDDLPHNIEVDISSLAVAEQALHVKDIKVSDKITILTDPDQMIIKVAEVRKVVEEVPAVALPPRVKKSWARKRKGKRLRKRKPRNRFWLLKPPLSEGAFLFAYFSLFTKPDNSFKYNSMPSAKMVLWSAPGIITIFLSLEPALR